MQQSVTIDKHFLKGVINSSSNVKMQITENKHVTFLTVEILKSFKMK